MNRLIGVVILLCCVTVYGGEMPDGFRGHKWGAPLSEFANPKLSRVDTGIEIYELENEKMNIGEAKLAKVGYGFYNNKFCCINVGYKGLQNYLILVNVLTQQYGPSEIPNKFLKRHTWENSKSVPVYISLDHNEIANVGFLLYMYMPLIEVKEKNDLSKARAAKKDL